MLLSMGDSVAKEIIINGERLFAPDICRVMAGPCAVESRDQILYTAEKLAKTGVQVFRAGAFKPRTDPYAFQGVHEKGLKWLDEARRQFGLKIITETSDMTNFSAVEEVTDIIQIGAKAMYNHALLRSAGQSKKPVLLKRHFSATVQELLKMADYILLEGNTRVMVCERGIRTFEPSTRFTLDLCGAASIQHQSGMLLVMDPSHSMGYSYGVKQIARACVAFGCNGLLIEVHPDPKNAQCDADQALNIEQFEVLFAELKKIGDAVGVQVC